MSVECADPLDYHLEVTAAMERRRNSGVSMDPNECVNAIVEAAERGDRATARKQWDDLQVWLGGGGAAPGGWDDAMETELRRLVMS